MKKIFILISLIFILSGIVVYADNITEKSDIKIVINGVLGNYTDVPIIKDNRTLLPFREVLKNLGVQDDDQHIIWNSTNKSITIIKDNVKIYLQINKNKAKLNDIDKNIDLNDTSVVPIIYKNRTYIPARFIAESFNMNVNWNSETETVSIDNKGSETTPMSTNIINPTPIPKISSVRDVEKIQYKGCEACKYRSNVYIRISSFNGIYINKYYASWEPSTNFVIVYERINKEVTNNKVKEFQLSGDNSILYSSSYYIKYDLLDDLMN